MCDIRLHVPVFMSHLRRHILLQPRRKTSHVACFIKRDFKKPILTHSSNDSEMTDKVNFVVFYSKLRFHFLCPTIVDWCFTTFKNQFCYNCFSVIGASTLYLNISWNSLKFTSVILKYFSLYCLISVGR